MIRINELIILTKLKQYDAPNTSLRLFIYLLIMIRISFRVKRDASGDENKEEKPCTWARPKRQKVQNITSVWVKWEEQNPKKGS
jgi:hypothetical protein